MGQTYSKSVDIWAIGIIMHIAISGGKHPFLDENDTYDSFKEKLKNLEVVRPDPSMSELAQSLFSKLVALKPHQRYIVTDALAHPWVTRELATEIPLSYMERMSHFELEQRLHNQMKMFMIFGFLLGSKQKLEREQFT